jgi:hypothetical protein
MSRIRRRFSEAWLLAFALVAAGFWAGCDSEFPAALPNEGPNTRISAGPPEATDTSFQVNLFWFGWDDDGFVDHYEIAFDDTSTWESPIFGNDSLFVLQASDTCCVEGLPEYVPPLPDSVYQQYHTFYVRSVDNNGVPDETPAFRSFNAKTIAPYTEIVQPSPSELGYWGTEVQVHWVGHDDDGVVVGYRYALTTVEDYIRDTGGTANDAAGTIIAWMDTITYFPNFSGGYFTDSLVWHATVEDSATFPGVTTTVPPNKILFAVRAIDNAGAEERILTRETNTRFFTVTTALDGPRITLRSNILGTWDTNNPPDVRDVFAGQGIHFEWRAVPGVSNAPVAGYSYAVEDTSLWTRSRCEFPSNPSRRHRGVLVPGRGRTFSSAPSTPGFLTPWLRSCASSPAWFAPNRRYILVVLDTDIGLAATRSGRQSIPGRRRVSSSSRVQLQVTRRTRGTTSPVSRSGRASSCSGSSARTTMPAVVPANIVPPTRCRPTSPAAEPLHLRFRHECHALHREQCTGQESMPAPPINFDAGRLCVADHWMATQFGMEASTEPSRTQTTARRRGSDCASARPR